MPIKKSELYSSLWKGCDELRGGMDASQYKDYVLVLLFVKYVSDKYAGQKDALLDVPKGGGFADMVALKGDKEIGDKVYSQLKLPIGEIKPAIFGHAEFTAFNATITKLFGKWRTANAPRLRAIKPGDPHQARLRWGR